MGEILEHSQAPARHRLDVDAYYKMAEAGILTRAHRVELIDGEIIDLNAIGSPHAAVTNRLARLLTRTARTQPRLSPCRARCGWTLSTSPNPISCCCGPVPMSIARATPPPPTCFFSLKFQTARSPMTAAPSSRSTPNSVCRRSGSSILPAPPSKSTAGRRRAPMLRGSAETSGVLTPELVAGVSIDVAALLA